MNEPLPSAAILLELPALSQGVGDSGPQWSHESTDLDLTLLRWRLGQQVIAHANDEVDVLLIGVSGAGEVIVNSDVYQLTSGQALLIPKGSERSMRCTAEHWSYLSVHRRRRGLWPTVRGE
jgi:quercetin dioxygenase-like cupin family protein